MCIVFTLRVVAAKSLFSLTKLYSVYAHQFLTPSAINVANHVEKCYAAQALCGIARRNTTHAAAIGTHKAPSQISPPDLIHLCALFYNAHKLEYNVRSRNPIVKGSKMAARTFAIPVINVPVLKDAETRQALIAITRQTEKWLRLANQKIDETSGNRGTPQVVSDVAALQAETSELSTSVTDLTNQLNSLVADQAPGRIISQPTIDDFTNAQHGHENAAGGGRITSAALTDYTTSTFTITATGFTTTVQGTAQYVKFASLVTLFIPTLSGTSNATTMTLTGIPVAIQTISEGTQTVPVQDNGVNLTTPGSVTIRAGSTAWDVYKDTAQGAFTNANAKTIYATFLVYHIL